MKNYHLIAASVLLCSPLCAKELSQHSNGTFFNAKQVEEIRLSPTQNEDVIVLRDGTRLSGKVLKLPHLPYAFGKLPINIHDIYAIAFSRIGAKDKMQVVTNEGLVYICSRPEERVGIVQQFPSSRSGINTLEQEIDLSTVSHAIFQKRSAPGTLPSRLFTLELENGDQIPVVLRQDSVGLSNGWREFQIDAAAIVNLYFDGGLYGTLKGTDGRETDLPFTFVKDKFLHVQIAKSTQTIGIPWKQVANLKMFEGAVPSAAVAADGLPPESGTPAAIHGKAESGIRKFREQDLMNIPEEIAWLERKAPAGKEAFTKGVLPLFSEEDLRDDHGEIAWLERNSEAHMSAESETAAVLARIFNDEDLQGVPEGIVWVNEKVEMRFPKDTIGEESVLALGELGQKPSKAGSNLLAQLNAKSAGLQDELARLKRMNTALESKNADLREQLTSCKTAHGELLNKQSGMATNLEYEMTRTAHLQSALDELFSKWERQKADNEMLQSALQRSEVGGTGYLEPLKRQIDQLQAELQREGQARKFSEKEVERYKTRLEQLAETAAEKHHELKMLQQAQAGLHASLMEQAKQQRRLLEEKRELESLLNLAEDRTVYKERFDGGRSQIEERQGDQRRLSALLMSQLEALNVQKNKAHAEVAALTRQIELLQERSSKASGSLVEYEREIGTLQQAMLEKNAVIEKFRMDHATLIKSLNAQLDLLKVENANFAAYQNQLEDKIGHLSLLLEKEQKEKEYLQEHIARMQEESLLSEKQLETLSASLEDKSRAFEAMQSEKDALRWELEANVDEMLRNFRKQKEVIEEQIAKVNVLTEEKAENETLRATLEEKIATLSQRLEEQQREKRELNAAVKAMESKALAFEKQAAQLNGVLSNTIDESKAERESYAAIYEELLEQIADLNAALVTEREAGKALKTKLEQSLGRAEEAESYAFDLQEELAAEKEHLLAELGALRAANERLSLELEDKRELMEREEQEFSLLNLKFQDAMVRLAAFESEVTQLNRELLGREVKIKEIEKRSSFYATKTAKELENLQKAMQEKDGANRLLQAELEELQDRVSALGEQIAFNEQTHGRSESELKEKVDSYAKTCNVLEADVQNLSANLSEERSRRKGVEELLQLTREELQKQESSNQALQYELKENLNQVLQLEEELFSYQEKLYVAGRELESLEKQRQLVRDLQEELEWLNKENKGSRKKIIALEEDNDLAAEQLRSLEAILGEVQSTLVEKNREIDEMTAAYEELRAETQKGREYQRRYEEVMAAFEEEKVLKKNLQEQLEELQGELTARDSALQESEGEKQQAVKKIAVLINENQTLRKERETLLNELQEGKKQYQEQKELVRRLTESLGAQKSALSQVEQSYLKLVSDLENARAVNKGAFYEDGREKPEAKPVPARQNSRETFSYRDIHIVADGENLNNISMRYYGTPSRWSDIYEVNREVIPDINRIKVGTTLVIPE